MSSPVADAFMAGAPGDGQPPPPATPLNMDLPPWMQDCPEEARIRALEQHVLKQPVKAEPPIEPAGWSPFQVAALRAGLTALLVGASTFLATFSQTSDAKVCFIATATAVVGVLSARFGLEGNYDSARFERAAAKRGR